jgi:hypothetical protein
MKFRQAAKLPAIPAEPGTGSIKRGRCRQKDKKIIFHKLAGKQALRPVPAAGMQNSRIGSGRSEIKSRE